MSDTFNTKYAFDVHKAILEAIVEISMFDDIDGKAKALVSFAEVTEALVGALAFFVANSAELDSPTKRRKFAENIGRALHRRVGEYQEYQAIHGPSKYWKNISVRDVQ
jgi:hypothetical protein